VRTPIGAIGGIHKQKKTIDIAVELALSAASSLDRLNEKDEKYALDALALGLPFGEGLTYRPADQICTMCKFPATIKALAILDGERAGLGALKLCASSIESGASSAMAITAISISALPYLLPDARRGKRMGTSVALDPLLLGEAPTPLICGCDLDTSYMASWRNDSLQKAHRHHALGGFKNEIAGCGGDDCFANAALWRQTPNVSQLSGAAWPMAPLAEGGCCTLLESRPRGPTLAEVLGFYVGSDGDGDVGVALEALRSTSGFDPLCADRIEIADPCASHPLGFIAHFGTVDASKVNPCGGALALGHIPGAAGLRALATLVHGLVPSQTGLCLQYGNGWSGGILVRRM
jgi:acetyl-CoA C-acetyltransferase